jgi:hypothetical protein
MKGCGMGQKAPADPEKLYNKTKSTVGNVKHARFEGEVTHNRGVEDTRETRDGTYWYCHIPWRK